MSSGNSQSNNKQMYIQTAYLVPLEHLAMEAKLSSLVHTRQLCLGIYCYPQYSHSQHTDCNSRKSLRCADAHRQTYPQPATRWNWISWSSHLTLLLTNCVGISTKRSRAHAYSFNFCRIYIDNNNQHLVFPNQQC